MRIITSTEYVTVKVRKHEILEGRWINYEVLTKKLGSIEKEKNIGYKSIRNRFYNSVAGDKFNIEEKAGTKWIDIKNPMKTNVSALVLEFVVEE